MSRIPPLVPLVVIAISLLAAALPAQLAPEPHASLILEVGQVVPGTGGRVAASVYGPRRIGATGVAIMGQLDFNEGFIWEVSPLAGTHGVILSSDYGARRFLGREFAVGGLYPPNHQPPGLPSPFASIGEFKDGSRGLFGQGGVIQRYNDPAPGIPGATVQFFQGFQMQEDGVLHWQARYQGAGRGNVLYESFNESITPSQILFRHGDPVPGGIARDLRNFSFSRDGSHHVHVFRHYMGLNARLAIYLDGAVPYLVGDPVPNTSETWTDFQFVDVDDQGRVLFGGATDALSFEDGVLAFDGEVVMRENDVVDGVHLTPRALPNQVRMDFQGQALCLWEIGGIGGRYAIFWTPDVTNFADTRLVIREGDELDFNGDGVTDATIEVFNFGNTTMAMSTGGAYVSVRLRYPNGDLRYAVIFQPYTV